MRPASQGSEGLFVSSRSALLSLGVDEETALWADRQQGIGSDGSVDAGGMSSGEKRRAGAVRIKEEEVEELLVDVEEAEEMVVDMGE